MWQTWGLDLNLITPSSPSLPTPNPRVPCEAGRGQGRPQDPGSRSHTAFLLHSNPLEIPEVGDPQCRSENERQAWGRPTDGDG